MVRTILMLLLSCWLIFTAFRNWFLALCALVVLTALYEIDLPKLTIVKGLNYWSIAACAVLISWFVQRKREVPFPRAWLAIMIGYLVVMGVALGRTVLNLDAYMQRAAEASRNLSYLAYTIKGFLVDNGYAPLRYVIIGLLFADGATTVKRCRQALFAVALTGLLYALIIHRHLPLANLIATGDELMKYRYRINRETGMHPNNIAAFLSTSFLIMLPAFWSMRSKWRWLLPVGMLTTLIALLHTHSRGGYVGFAASAVLVCVLMRKWGTLGVLAALVVVLCVMFPAVPARMMTGLDEGPGGEVNTYEATGGRDIIWAAAVVGIEASPLLGHGKFGYVVSPALDNSMENGGGEQHPHCAYLEVLLDCGVLGFPFILAPFLYTLVKSCKMAWPVTNPVSERLFGACGVSASAVLLFQGMTGQHFVLDPNLFLYWCVAGVIAGYSPHAEAESARQNQLGSASASVLTRSRSVSVTSP